ncbi:MAG: hypothetical protein QM496_09385 [Verrucomicrobiota bacterium]
MRDVVESPLTWILTGICVVGCIYAKRSVISGIITGIMAPMVIVPLWIMAGLAVNVPHLLVRKMFPDLLPYLQNSSSAWASGILFVTDPAHLATGITAGFFIWYCIVGRMNSHRPLAFTLERNTITSPSPLTRRFWH